MCQGYGKHITTKLEAMKHYPFPTTYEIFFIISFYRKLRKIFSSAMNPLIDLLKMTINYWCKENYDEYFEEIKSIFTGNPVLSSPDSTKQFQLIADANGVGIDDILLQGDDRDID